MSNIQTLAQKLKEAAEYKAKMCKTCNKPKFYTTRQGQQIEHVHERLTRPVHNDGDFTEYTAYIRPIYPDMVPEYTERPPAYSGGNFVARLREPEAFKMLARAINVKSFSIEEATFIVNSSGLMFRQMDPSHVLLVDCLIAPQAFEKFDDMNEVSRLSVRVEDLVKILNRVDKADSLELSMVPDSTDTISIDRLDDDGRMHYTVNLIETGTTTAPLPRLEYETSFAVETKAFLKTLGDISVVSDQATFVSSEKGITFTGKSDIGKAEKFYSKNDKAVLEFAVQTESRSTFSIDYVVDYLKALKTDWVRVEYSTQKPLRVRYPMSALIAGLGLGTGFEAGYIDLYLAPHVSDYPTPPPQPAPEAAPEPEAEEAEAEDDPNEDYEEAYAEEAAPGSE